jgi:hypothetical protein
MVLKEKKGSRMTFMRHVQGREGQKKEKKRTFEVHNVVGRHARLHHVKVKFDMIALDLVGRHGDVAAHGLSGTHQQRLAQQASGLIPCARKKKKKKKKRRRKSKHFCGVPRKEKKEKG